MDWKLRIANVNTVYITELSVTSVSTCRLRGVNVVVFNKNVVNISCFMQTPHFSHPSAALVAVAAMVVVHYPKTLSEFCVDIVPASQTVAQH